jgi:hypothetical protein
MNPAIPEDDHKETQEAFREAAYGAYDPHEAEGRAAIEEMERQAALASESDSGMASATAQLPEPRFPLTFGRSRMEVKWQDRREIGFAELGAMLREAPVGPKDGPCYTPATFAGGARRKDQATEIHIVVLDADCGHTLDEIQNAIAARDWRAIIHSTHSHLTERSHIAAAAAEKWLAANPGQTIAGYMVAKAGYLPRVVANAHVVDEVAEGAARNLVVQHAPCPKYRVILPLDQPWIAAEYQTQDLANAKWRERIGALAHALGLHHDQSCVDTSRLFYLPRRRNEDQPFQHVMLEGDPCDLWGLPDAAPVAPAAPGLLDTPKARAPHLQAVNPAHKTAITPDGEFVDLTAWAAQFGARFEIMDALRAKAPGIFSRRQQGVKHHIICPNSGSHVTNGAEGTGTFVVNASQVGFAQMPSVNGFVIHCMHNGCAGLDRLDHMRALLEAGALSPDDLASPAFLMPDIPQIDPSAMLQSKGERIAEEPEAPEEGEDQGNIPPALYANLPGALGLMFDWVLATSPKPQPGLVLGACLAFMAACLGQRVKLQKWATRPNMYALGIGYSTSGKERAFSAIKEVARAAGLTKELIGPEELSSDAGIVTAVIKSPAHVMLIDEVSFLLSAANARSAGPHVANIIGTLLKLYSSSHTTYSSKAYADGERVKTVDQPCVSFYGACTPAGLSSALSSKDITNGLLSRMVLFDAGDRDPLSEAPSQEAPPIALVDWVTAWHKVSPMRNPMARVGFEPVLEPLVVMMTDEADAISEAFKLEMHKTKLRARARGTDSLYGRAHENALKFALIRACAAVLPISGEGGPCIDEGALVVDAACMLWAVELSRATVVRMEATTSDIADTQFQADMRALRKVIKNGGARGATMREIGRTTAGKHPKKLLDDLLTALCSAGEVFWVAGIKTSGRPRDAYVHASLIHHHGRSPGEEETA